jgi:hypothetical protein
MTPEEFSRKIYDVVVEENMAIYRRTFLHTKPSEAADPYYKRVLTLFNEVSPAQKDCLFEIMRQVTVDTVSSVLGVIDGSSLIDSNAPTFELMCGVEHLEGDLQMYFLNEDDERHDRNREQQE